MNKVGKILQCMAVCGLICVASPKNADALFGLTPPLPFSVDVDVPDNGSKIISYLKAVYRELQTLDTAANSLDLEAIKGGNLDSMMGLVSRYAKKGPKTPTKDPLEKVAELNLEQGELREDRYFNAFDKLFFEYPSSNPEDHVKYHKKAVEFKQDMIIDAYVTARLTEDYLALVEKTIRRLDRCQEGVEKEACEFFGLKWSFVKTSDKQPNDENNEGQMGEARNAYIVITLYDRLMRIVEDLTATEAMFRASQSIDVARPVSNSDASEYINQKFRFAHHQEHETMYASDGGNSQESYKKARVDKYDIAKILGKLHQIDEWQQAAMNLHNLKVKLPEYKALYRKYLKAKENHKRALKVLGESDKCAQTFIDTHKKYLKEQWGASNPINDYDKRTGISRELIEKYQAAIQNTIIEDTNELCPGYYTGDCPAGYTQGDDCEVVTTEDVINEKTGKVTGIRKKVEKVPGYHECIMETSMQDIDRTADAEVIDTIVPSEGSKNKHFNSDFIKDEGLASQDDMDYLEDDLDMDKVNKDARIKEERAWRIGSEKVVKMTKEAQLQFEAWNDLKYFQAEYLRQKYNNMKLIVLAVDDAFNTMKIAHRYVQNEERVISDLKKKEKYNKAKTYVTAFSGCKPATLVTTADGPIPAWCSEGDVCSACTITSANDASGEINVKKKLWKKYPAKYDKDGKLIQKAHKECEIVKTKTFVQTVEISWGENGHGTGKCDFPQTPQDLKGSGSPCGQWDITGEFLVQNYFLAVDKLGNCETDYRQAAENMRHTAKDMLRNVSQDMVAEIIEKREELKLEMQLFVRKYDESLADRKRKLGKLRDSLGDTNAKITIANNTKNEAEKAQKNSDLRVESIKKEIDYIDQQIELNKTQPVVDKTTGLEKHDFKQECTLQVDKYKLRFEAMEICKGADVGNHPHCSYFQGTIEPWEQCEGFKACEKVREDEKEENPNKQFKADKEMIKKLKPENVVRNFVVYDEYDSHNNKFKKCDGDECTKEDTQRLVRLLEADTVIDTQEKLLDKLREERDTKKNEIKEHMKFIEEKAKAFAIAYIEKATEHQKNLDEMNATYEKYMEDVDGGDPKRMQYDFKRVCTREPFFIGIKRCKNTAGEEYSEDNLRKTLQEILYRENHKGEELPGKEKIIWQGFQDRWNIEDLSIVDNALAPMPIHPEIHDAVGVGTRMHLAEIVRDLLAEAASEVLDEYIRQIDADVRLESERGKELINAIIDNLEVWKEEDREPSLLAYRRLSLHSSYYAGADIVAQHAQLLKDLRKPVYLAKYGETDLSEFFGIPTDGELYTTPSCESSFNDDDYFVGLPARSNNYIDKPADDINGGRDFRAPNHPLLYLPPVREVFYFSALDYEDMPREEEDTPSWTTFLNKKYVNDRWNDYPKEPGIAPDVAEWEYLPETWRYILARPNMREDGKYQQSFVERPFGDGPLYKRLLEQPGDYDQIIARSDVFPCMLGNDMIDMQVGSIAISKFPFISLPHMPVGMTLFKSKGLILPEDVEVNLSPCKEIAYNSDKSTVCYIHNKNKGQNSVCHLLADHGMKNEDGDPIEDSQNLPKGDYSAFHFQHSELGRLFEFRDNKLRYRTLQQNMQEYLLSEDEDKAVNDMLREKIERASFKHNIFGSFLEAVNAEHSLKKNMDSMKQNLEDAMFDLCRQVHAQEHVVGDYGDPKELRDPKCDSECQEAFHKKCVAYILNGQGLATSADEDKSYGVDGEYGNADFNTVNCAKKAGTMYEELFCKLDEWKNELVEKSRNAKEKKVGYKNERDEDEVNTYVGFNKLGDIQDEGNIRENVFGDSVNVSTDEVKERMEIIYKYDKALETDKNETVVLSPSLTLLDSQEAVVEQVNKDIAMAKANRTQERESDEDAIKAMDNQSQVVPYCPIYMNNKWGGL